MAQEKQLLQLPPGCRFYPSDYQLIRYFLLPRLADPQFASYPVKEFNVFNAQPWEIWKQFDKLPLEDLFFFTDLAKKGSKAHSRKINGGPAYWKVQNRGDAIDVFIPPHRTIHAIKKHFTYINPESDEDRWWILYEYSVPSGNIVLYRLKDKHEEEKNKKQPRPKLNTKRKRNGSQPSSVDQDNRADILPQLEAETVHDNLTKVNDDHMEANSTAVKKRKTGIASSVATLTVEDCLDYEALTTTYQPSAVYQDEQQQTIANNVTTEPSSAVDRIDNQLVEVAPGTDNQMKLDTLDCISRFLLEDFDDDQMAANQTARNSNDARPTVSAVEDEQNQEVMPLVIANSDAQAAVTEGNALIRECLAMIDCFSVERMAAESIASSSSPVMPALSIVDDVEIEQWMQLEHSNDGEEAVATENLGFDRFNAVNDTIEAAIATPRPDCVAAEQNGEISDEAMAPDSNDFDLSLLDDQESEVTHSGNAYWTTSFSQMLLQTNSTCRIQENETELIANPFYMQYELGASVI